MEYHSLDIKAAYKNLNSSEKGLKEQDAKTFLEKNGPNILKEKEKNPAWKIFLSQFNSFIIWILIAATIISFFIGEEVDAIVILAILILNGILGFVQEYKAEKSIEALKKMTALKAKVIRDGKEMSIPSAEIVIGDILVLEAGDKVPADARLIESVRLEIDESSLTGESVAAKKDASRTVKAQAGLGDRVNMAFSSTIVTKGRGKAIAVATGMNTQIGNIATMVQSQKTEQTPLQEKLDDLGKFLGIGTLVICAVVFMVIFMRDRHILETLMFSISLAVAAIPEGLAAVVTICLALGVQRMIKKNALVRQLHAVETLGSTNVICTDKTGTLTYNQMTVREIYANNRIIEVSGQGYIPKGEFTDSKGKKVKPSETELLMKTAVLCNDSELREEEGRWKIFGDPTEAALVVAAKKQGIDKKDLDKRYPRKDELPFDSDRKLMTTVHPEGKKTIAYVKGAPDNILKKCKQIFINGKVRALSAKDRNAVLAENERMAKDALRVLGFAYRELKAKTKESDMEKDLIFVGLMGMIDPPRTEVKDSIKTCKEAGIKVVMITGDHKTTAVAIANELGIGRGNALTGEDIDRIYNENHTLKHIVDDIDVYARVSPQHKLMIVEALKDKGYVVAMTGDGVNDAPALKRSDIGISMGISGTDVAKEASEMVLTDDNFTSIVSAVEEGRGIYSNIKKFIKYLLSSNIGEVLTVFFAVLIGLPLPLLPLQLLWINIVTDAFPALALGVDPNSKEIMKEKPRQKKEKVLLRREMIFIMLVGVVMTLGTLGMFYYELTSQGWNFGDKIVISCLEGDAGCTESPGYLKTAYFHGITMAFTTIVLFQLINVFNCRSEKKSILGKELFGNKKLIYAVLLSFGLQLIVIYTPLSQYFKTVKLGFIDWVIIICVSLSVVAAEEIRKLIVRSMDKRDAIKTGE